MGVSFDFNEGLPNTGRVLNSRRITRFVKCAKETELKRYVFLAPSPTNKRFQGFQSFIDSFIKSALSGLYAACLFHLQVNGH